MCVCVSVFAVCVCVGGDLCNEHALFTVLLSVTGGVGVWDEGRE